MTANTVLAREVEQTFRQFVYLPNDHCYTVATLWVMHTHLRDVNGRFLPFITPRLTYLSRVAGAGKTTALEITTHLSHNGELVIDPTPPSIVTLIDSERATLGFDEIDLFFGRGFGQSSMRTILNGGYKRGAYVTKRRMDEVVRENIHAPVVMAGKNAAVFLTAEKFETLRTRSHCILMEPKPIAEDDDETEEYDQELHIPRLLAISAQLKRWGLRHGPDICSEQPKIPAAINNRNREIWKVLFQIAGHLENEWPDRVMVAARAFVFGEHDDESARMIASPADELLNWVRAIFQEDEDDLPSAVIVERLMELPEDAGHWWHREWRTERGATMGLSRQLAAHGIAHAKLYRPDGSTPWGYRRVDLGLQPSNLPPSNLDEDEDEVSVG